MAPWYIPAVKLAVFAETFTEAVVVPDPGVTDSHGAPAPAVALKASEEPPLMLTCCAVGAVPPIWNVKGRRDGVGVIPGKLETTTVTSTVCELAPLAVIVMVPL